MGNRILAFVVVVILCVGGWYAWKHYKQANAQEDGEVRCVGCMTPEQSARYNREDHGDTADGQSERKQETARQSAADIANGGTGDGRSTYQNAQANTANDRFNNDNANRAVPADAGGQTSMKPAPPQRFEDHAPATYDTSTGNMGSPTPVTYPPPANDSQTANAPNGMRFAGSGTYQWYRQGDLTWRVDTVTGHSCIVYATMEEWRKQIVMSHGCGRDA